MVEVSEKTARILDEMCEELLEDIIDVAELYIEEEDVEGYRDYETLKHYRKLLEAYEMTKLLKCGLLGKYHGHYEYKEQTGTTATMLAGRA